MNVDTYHLPTPSERPDKRSLVARQLVALESTFGTLNACYCCFQKIAMFIAFKIEKARTKKRLCNPDTKHRWPYLGKQWQLYNTSARHFATVDCHNVLWHCKSKITPKQELAMQRGQNKTETRQKNLLIGTPKFRMQKNAETWRHSTVAPLKHMQTHVAGDGDGERQRDHMT